jgi:hypothetical protein
MGEIVVFALLSAIYPTLIAATAVMLLLPGANGLMLGFWLGAMITGVTCGLVILFALHDSRVVTTTRHTISPAVALVLAALLGLAAIGLAKGEDRRVRERRHARHAREAAKTPMWRKALREGNPWHTFVLGIVLSFPGVWYLAALDRLTKDHYSNVVKILVVVAFCFVQLLLIEIPMLAFRIWPEETPAAIDRARSWASAHARRYGVRGLAIVAGLLAIDGVIGAVR